MITQQLNSNLFTQEDGKRFITTKVLVEDLDVDINTAWSNVSCSDEDSWFILQEIKTIKDRYSKVLSFDTRISNGVIKKDKVKGAKGLRKSALSGLLNYMARNRIVDFNILKAEGIADKELVRRYWEHHHTAEFIRDAVCKYPFIVKKMNQLAEEGEPYYSKNGREIAEKSKEIERLGKQPLPQFKGSFNQMLKDISDSVNPLTELENTVKELEKHDIPGGKYYPIANICHVERNKGTDSGFSGKHLNDLSRINYKNLSQGVHKKLIKLIVEQYNAENSKDIAEYRKEKNRERKNANRNTKPTTATDKRELVQNLKKQGFNQKQVISKVDFSVRTVKRCWK